MGIKKNISYSIILTLSQYLIGFITFPYISRILGASNIGIVSFVDNTINYFVLFSTLGASIIGTREIAKYQNDKEKLSAAFSSLITVYAIYTFIVVIVYICAVLYIDKLHIYQELFYIGIAKLIFSVFLIEWFYRGIENFKYITTRTIIIKIIYVLSLFVFVRDSSHYKIYFALTTSTVVINALINILYSRNFVQLTFKNIKLKPYFKQSFYLGSYSLLTSMYTTFNVMYLGFVSNSAQVGFYWAAVSLYSILLGVFTAFTAAMMPRMSSLLFHGEIDVFESMIIKSFGFLFTLSFPLIFGSIVLAPQIINILTGNGFGGAILPMQIIMPLILVVGIAQILAVQVILPKQKDKIILFASIIGALIGVLLNILLVKKYGSVGTAFVLLFSESAVTIFYIYASWRSRLISFPWGLLAKNFLWSLPILIILIIFSNLFSESNIIIILTSVSVSVLYFLIVQLYVIKNHDLADALNLLKSKISK